MTKTTDRAVQLCIHAQTGWSAHPELTRWIALIGARFCVVCINWNRARDEKNFLRYVRTALMEGKTEMEIARALGLDGIADPFAQPPRTYLSLLLANAKYEISGNTLKPMPA